MDNKEIEYIAQRYKSGRFSTGEAWKKMGFRLVSGWTRSRVAAAIVLAIGLTATAAIVINQTLQEPQQQKKEPVEATQPSPGVGSIDFEDASLPDVIRKIKEVYGVEITGVPDNGAEYKLSLHYDGDVENLVSTINEILDTQLAVKKK